MNRIKKSFVLAAALIVGAVAVAMVSVQPSRAAESSYKFTQVADLRRLLASIFNTSTGHNHDGVTSRALTTLGTVSALRLTPLNASTTGFILTGIAGQTADLVQISTAGAPSPMFRVGKSGHVGLRQYTKAQIDALVPDFAGAKIICSDCNFAYSDCNSSGTAVAQWFALKTSTGGENGGGTHQIGCGTGQ